MWFPKILENFEIIKKFYFRSWSHHSRLNSSNWSLDGPRNHLGPRIPTVNHLGVRIIQYAYFIQHTLQYSYFRSHLKGSNGCMSSNGCINTSNTPDKIQKASTESDISVIRTRVPAQDPIWLPKRHKTSQKLPLYGQNGLGLVDSERLERIFVVWWSFMAF